MPNIYIPLFNLLIQNPIELQRGTIAVLDVPLQWWNGLFTYETVGGVTRYYVNMPNAALFNLDLANAVVQLTNQPMFEDALDRLALETFGVADRTRFVNITDLENNVVSVCGPNGPVVQNIRTSLLRLIVGSGVPPYTGGTGGLLIDNTGRGYLTEQSINNICGEVYRQLPSERRQNGALMFESGDTISFTYTFTYLNTGASTRLYNIKLNLVS
jgi:hypothetical protein